MQRRIALTRRQAGLEYRDPRKVGLLAEAGAESAREIARLRGRSGDADRRRVRPGPDGQQALLVDFDKLRSLIGLNAMHRFLAMPGVTMARPPSGKADDDGPPPGIGHNSIKTPNPNDNDSPPPVPIVPPPGGVEGEHGSPRANRQIDEELVRVARRFNLTATSPSTQQLLKNLDM